MANKTKGKIGSSFDDFLAEQRILEMCEEQAIKQILADQTKAAAEEGGGGGTTASARVSLTQG